MTEQMRDLLNAEIKEAEASGDPIQMQRANLRVNSALLECTARTSDKVKRIETEFAKIRYRKEGAKMLWNFLQMIASAGGGALILKLLEVL